MLVRPTGLMPPGLPRASVSSASAEMSSLSLFYLEKASTNLVGRRSGHVYFRHALGTVALELGRN